MFFTDGILRERLAGSRYLQLREDVNVGGLSCADDLKSVEKAESPDRRFVLSIGT